MSPSTLLRLWRDRWHKPLHPGHSVPLEQGKISRWMMELAHAGFWSVPGAAWAALLVAGGMLLLAVSAHLTVNSQIVLGWSLIGFAVYLRRHHGQVMAMAIAGISLLLSLRYFYWRVDTTLPPYLSVSLALGLALVLAELHGWLRGALDYIARLWPIEQGPTALPHDAVVWPTVHLVMLATQPLNPAALQHSLAQRHKLDWPPNKCQWTLLVSDEDPALTAVASAAGVQVQCFPHAPPTEAAARVNRALYESDADIVVLVDSTTALPAEFLRQTVGWFVDEPRLGLVLTPDAFLAPRPTPLARQHRNLAPGGPDWVLARRSALLEVGGLCLDTPTRENHTALALQRAGYFSAYGAWMPTAEGPEREAVRIDDPFKPGSLPVRLRIHSLRQALDFYYPVALSIFCITPFAALCFGASPLATDLLALSAYWIPHWVGGRMVLAPASAHARLRWLDFLKEELGALAVLVRTTKSFAMTNLRRLVQRMAPSRSAAAPTVPTTSRPKLLPATALLALSSVLAVLNWERYSAVLGTLHWLYLVWALLLALQLVAGFAVQRERDWVRWTHRRNAKLAVMLRLDAGHLHRTTTRNFPLLPLELDLPDPAGPFTPGQALHLSVFSGYREFALEVQVVSLEPGGPLRLAIPAAAAADYQHLVSAVCARSADWPQWLPPATADRLLPGWLARLLLRAQDAFYNFAVKSAMPTTLQRIRAWLKPGKTTNG